MQVAASHSESILSSFSQYDPRYKHIYTGPEEVEAKGRAKTYAEEEIAKNQYELEHENGEHVSIDKL